MIILAPPTTQQEKIAALKKSLLALDLIIPSLIVIWYVMPRIGYTLPLVKLLFLFAGATIFSLSGHLCVSRKWLIGPLYHYVFAAILWGLIALGIYLTGTIASPFIWMGLFAAVFDILAYYPFKGLIAVLFFILFLWVFALGEMVGVIPHNILLPELILFNDSKYVILMLSGYTMLYGVVASTTAYLSGQLRREKQGALASAEEQKKSLRVNLSIMEDLEAARGQLESRIKEIEDSRRATLHLLQDVEQSRGDAQQKTAEIAKLYNDLKAVDRMKTEFLSVISNELRTPLTSILHYVSMFLSEQFGKLPLEYIKQARDIKNESEHLVSLIDSVLDMMRLERGKTLKLNKEPVAIPLIVAELVEVMRPQINDQALRVETDLAKELPTLLADPAKLRQVFTNLLGNAVKFTPKGGWVKIVGTVEDDRVKITVSDGGIGIAKENLEKIFDKFFQVDSSYVREVGGVGLGLPIAKEIVETHGGRIWAESAGLGMGTAICFTLPIEE